MAPRFTTNATARSRPRWTAWSSHRATFISQTEASTGSALPRLIKEEFDAFLECGILAHGVQGRLGQAPSCPKCKGTKVVRNGQAESLQRHKCRGCGVTVSR